MDLVIAFSTTGLTTSVKTLLICSSVETHIINPLVRRETLAP